LLLNLNSNIIRFMALKSLTIWIFGILKGDSKVEEFQVNRWGLTFKAMPGCLPSCRLFLVQDQKDMDLLVVCPEFTPQWDKKEFRSKRHEEAKRLRGLRFFKRILKKEETTFCTKNKDFEVNKAGKEEYQIIIDEIVKKHYRKYWKVWRNYWENPTFKNYCRLLPFILKCPDLHSELRQWWEASPSIGNCLILTKNTSKDQASLLLGIFLAQRGFIPNDEVYNYWKKVMARMGGYKNPNLCQYVIDHFVYPLEIFHLISYVRKIRKITSSHELSLDDEKNVRKEEELLHSNWMEQQTNFEDIQFKDFHADKLTGYSKLPFFPTQLSSIQEGVSLRSLAKKIGVVPETLWHYQKRGLLDADWGPSKRQEPSKEKEASIEPGESKKLSHGPTKTVLQTEKTKKTLKKLYEKKKRKKLVEKVEKIRGISHRSAQVWMTRQIRGKGKTLEEIERELENLVTIRRER
jgi:hypothetical protein